MLKIISSLVLLAIANNSFAQKEDFVWRLGGAAGVDFSSGIPDTFSISNPNSVIETNAGICDSAGNLLFYTNGVAIFNSNHDTLLNGDNLNPCLFTTDYAGSGLPLPQADIIVKRPGNNSEYYLFHETNESLFDLFSTVIYLSVIDMSLDSGRGGVTALKNFHLYENDSMQPGLSAVRHANGIDWWLLAKKSNHPYYYRWLVKADTILGPMIQTDQPGFNNSFGFQQACFSMQGDKFALISNGKQIFVYNFDRCTGLLSHIYDQVLSDSSGWGAGCAFSLSGRYLYFTTQFFVHQFDLMAPNIYASHVTVAIYDGFASPQVPLFTRFNLMKLGPNGKIYISTDNGTDVLHVIESPDSAGLSCNVQQHSLYLSPPIGNVVSVPNIPNYRLGASEINCDSILGLEETTSKSNTASVYPNPAHGSFKVRIDLMERGYVTFIMKDILGQIILQRKVLLTGGIHNEEVDCINVAPGMYLLSISSKSYNAALPVLIH